MQAMLFAQGKALALVATVLERGGVISATEFGNLFALFATVVGEDMPDQGQILALWAATIKDAVDTLEPPG